MRTEQELKNWINNARHCLEAARKETQSGENASRIVETEAEFAKALFSLGRLHYKNQQYAVAIPLFTEAQSVVGPSLESSYFLMYSLSELGKWDEAYEMFLISRGQGYTGRKHPLYDDPEENLASLKGLGKKVVDHCSRIHKQVSSEEYQDWHWNKRFKSLSELIMIAEGYYAPGTGTEISYHPFEFRPHDREFQFHGLTNKGIPFKLDKEGDFVRDSRYSVRVEGLLTCPQSDMGKEDAASWLKLSFQSIRL